ncbi:MAG TPA: hypothetical protein VNK91_09085, partial [Burkholderiaceae bacterium]|nr:hypothetical protein [Burkholderiaceae bacterium]
MTTSPQLARRWRLAAGWVALGLIAVAGAAAAVAWLVGTSTGLAAIVRLANALTPVRIAAEDPQGSLRDGFAFARLRVTVADTEVELRDLTARIAAVGLRPWRIDFETLAASRVAVHVRPSPVPASEPPHSIAAPIAVRVARLQVGEFALRVGTADAAQAVAAREIEGALSLDPEGYRIERAAFVFGRADAPLAATVAGTVGGIRPFALSARGTLASRWQDKPLQASLAAAGSLERFDVTASVAGGGASGMLAATVASFAAPALRSLRADLSGIDPRLWAATAPQADLRLQADLEPLAGGSFGLAGRATVQNGMPGPIDGGRIPARSATGRLLWHGAELRVEDAEIQLVRGRARGDFASQFGAAAWQTEARLSAVDPSAIHSKLRPLRVDGHVSARHSAEGTAISADLHHRGDFAASLAVDLRATARSVQLQRALLTAGGGRLEAGGEIALTGTRRVQLKGTATALDAARLVSGLAVRVDGEFEIDGQLQPQPSGRLDLRLTDGMAFGRPLAGHAALNLSPQQELTADLDLTVRSARLRAYGG